MVGLTLLPEDDHIQVTSGSESETYQNLFFKYAFVLSYLSKKKLPKKVVRR